MPRAASLHPQPSRPGRSGPQSPPLGTILRSIADEVDADPGMWVQHVVGLDENRLPIRRWEDLDDAVQLSLGGMLHCALFGHRTWDRSNAMFRAEAAILDAAGVPRATWSVGAWEDMPGRTVEEISGVLRAAADLCDEQDEDLRNFSRRLAA